MGLCLSLLPIPFAGMLLALAAAPLVRLNLAATYVGTAVVNPLTGAFFYAAELWLGMTLMGAVPPSWAELRALDGTGWWELLLDLIVPFVLGASVLMVVSVLLTYPLVRLAVTRWRHPSMPASEPTTKHDAAPPS